MNAENQEFLNAIRGIVTEVVTEAVAPLVARIGALEERIGALVARIGVLEERIGALEERVGALEERIGVLEERVGRVEARLDNTEARLVAVEASIRRLEDMYETLDTRTRQIASDLLFLRERTERGFRQMHNDFRDVLDRLSDIQKTQSAHASSIAALEQRVNDFQQRPEKLEAMQRQS